MCQCTPEIRTPWCGKPGCEEPPQRPPSPKPTLCLDFDGVLNSYASGWAGAGCIPDPPVDGAQEFCRQAQEYFELVICSTRASMKHGRVAIERWLEDHGFPKGISVTAEKPPAQVYIDDRAIRFDGVFGDPKELLTFRPWYNREA